MAGEIQTLMANLHARGIVLREPAREKDILAFESSMGLQLGGSVREVYTLFNGFRCADHQSQIFLWGLDEIARRNCAETQLRKGYHLAIGDLLIDSDFLVTDLTRVAPVTFLFEGREVGPSFLDLVVQLGYGKFDFLAAKTL
jgi:hypothetical protein